MSYWYKRALQCTALQWQADDAIVTVRAFEAKFRQLHFKFCGCQGELHVIGCWVAAVGSSLVSVAI